MRVVDARQTFLGIWIRQLIEGSAIKVFGDGLQLRDFNFVDDCVDALLLAATNEAAIGQVYNLGSREVVNLKSLAELMIQMVAGGRFEIVPLPADRKAIDIGDYYNVFSAIERDLERSEEKRVGKSVSVRVDLGGRRRHK